METEREGGQQGWHYVRARSHLGLVKISSQEKRGKPNQLTNETKAKTQQEKRIKTNIING